MSINYVPQMIAPTLDGSPIRTRAIADINDPLRDAATINVLDYGADPTGVVDSSAAMSAATGSISIGGLYRNGSVVQIRVT